MRKKAYLCFNLLMMLSMVLGLASGPAMAAPPASTLQAEEGFTYVSTDVPKTISDHATIYSSIVVPVDYEIRDVNVTIADIHHTYDGDIDMFLNSPAGTRIELSTDNGSNGDNYIGTLFDDEAATPISAGSAPFTGSFRPEAPLSAVDGQSSSGTWRLEIYDDANGDTGTLNGWSLTLTLYLPHVLIEPEDLTGAACQGQSVVYTFNVINASLETDTINLTYQENDWPVTLNPESVVLDTGESAPVTVRVDVPSYVFNGDVDTTTIIATGENNPGDPFEATLQTFAGNLWMPAATGGSPALWPAYAGDGDALYTIDGLNASGAPTNRVQIFDGSAWTTGATHPAGTFYGGVAGYFEGMIYYAPGFTSGYVASNAFYAYDVEADSWSTRASRPAALGLGAGGVTSNGKFVWIGGSPNAGFSSTTSVYVYDIAGDTWEEGTSLSTVGFTASGYVASGTKIFVAGNYFGSALFYQYDVVADGWTRLADLPVEAGKVSPLLIASGTDIYLIGGGLTAGNAMDTAWRYDTAWHPFVSINTAVLGNGGGMLNGGLYSFGGGAGSAAALSPVPHEVNLPDCEPVVSAVLQGTVTNGVTDEPIEGALVEATGTGSMINSAGTVGSDITDLNGHYELVLYDPATYDVTASYDGFDSKTDSIEFSAAATHDFILGPVAARVNPASFDVTLPWGETDTEDMTIYNDGYSIISWELSEENGGEPAMDGYPAQIPSKNRDPKPLEDQSLLARGNSGNATVDAGYAADGDVSLIYDTGTQTNGLVLRDTGTNTEFRAVLFNRFPASAVTSFPFVLQQIDIHEQDTAPLVGLNIQLLIYADPDGGDPTNAVLLYQEVVPVQTDNGWNTYVLSEPVLFPSEADVLIGFSTIYADGGVPWPGTRYPYPMDETAPHGNSFVAWMNTATDPVDPSDLSGFPNFSEMGDIGYPTDWMIRGYGQTGGLDIPWLSENPITGTITVQGSQLDQLTFDARVVSNSGTYTGTLTLGSNDPANSQIAIPVTLHVTQNPASAVIQGTVSSDRPGGPLEGATVNITGTAGFTVTLTTGADGTYSVMVPPASIPGDFDFTVSTTGYLTETLTKAIVAGTNTVDFELVLDSPWIGVSPASLSATLLWGDSSSKALSVENTGAADLLFTTALGTSIDEAFEGAFPPAGWQVIDNGGCGVWMSTDEWERDNYTGGTGFAADADSDACGSGMDTELWTPTLDLASVSSATLTFRSDFNDLGDDGYVDISTDGGVTWINLLHYAQTDYRGPRLETINLTPYVGSADTIIRFHYVAPGWDWWWEIDDVQVVAPLNWLDWTPGSGTVVTGSTQDIDVTFDASQVDRPGIYPTSIRFLSNDLTNPLVNEPVTLVVGNNPDQGYLSGHVLGNRTPAGADVPLEGALVTLENVDDTFETTTDAAGFYEFYLTPDQTGDYTVTVTFTDYLDGNAAVSIAQGETLTQDFTLLLDSPNMVASPESISETVAWGGDASQDLTISNPDPAQSDLAVDIFEVAPSYTPPEVQTIQIHTPAFITGQIPVAGAVLDSPASTGASQQTLNVRLDNLPLGQIKVGIFSYDSTVDPAYVALLEMMLEAYPGVDATVLPIPVTLDELMAYNVVIVGSRYSSASWDADGFGNLFADYVDAGGRVILIQNAFLAGDTGGTFWKLGGRFETQFAPVAYGTARYYGTESLAVYNPGHPMMAGWDPAVNSVTDSFRSFSDLTLANGGVPVAYWNTGNYYIVANPYAVAFNQVLTYDYMWSGDVPMLLHNAVMYLFKTDVPWLSESETSFTIPVDGSDSTTVSLDASVPEVTQPGTYHAWLWLDNNDLLQTGAYVPVDMIVQPAADMGNLAGTVTLDRSSAGENVPAKGAEVTLTSVLGTINLTTNASGHFTYYYLASDIPTSGLIVTVNASMDGYQDASAVVTVRSGQNVAANLQLKFLSPWIQSSPDGYDITIKQNGVITVPLTVDNIGLVDLTFSVLEFPPTVTLPSALVVPSALAPMTLDTAPVEIEAGLLDAASSNPTNFWIKLRQGADLSGSQNISNKTTRGAYVYQSLKAVAGSTQQSVIAYLDSQGLKYESHWINNSIFVYGGSAQNIRDLSVMSDVRLLRAEHYTTYTGDLFGPGMTLSLPPLVGPSELDSVNAWSGTAWGLDFINAPTVWETYGIKGEGIVVANIDTGVQWDHPALETQYRGWDGSTAVHDYNWFAPTTDAQGACTGAADAPCDWAGHGSHTMGSMVGDDGVAGDNGHRTGVAPASKWMACMGCDTPPNQCSDAALTSCAEWIVAPTDLDGNNPDPSKAPDVVNNSWGGGPGDDWYQSYVEAWVAAGIFPAFSSGNPGDMCSGAGSPGDYLASFASGAVDSAGTIADFSGRGPGTFDGAEVKPNLVAPGVSICSTIPGDGYDCSYSGTSMASPHTAGAVALLWDASPALRGDIASTFEILQNTADPNTPPGNCSQPGDPGTLPNYTYGYGYLDAFAGVKEVYVFDIPWVKIVPNEGTVSSEDTQELDVVFDSTGLATGIYSGTLRITHNDPLSTPVDIPLRLTVTRFGASLAPAAVGKSGTPGAVVEYELTVTNTGGVADVYDLDVTSGWDVLYTSPVSLDAGKSTTITVQVTVPVDALKGDQDVAILTVTSRGDPSVAKPATLTTTVVFRNIFLPVVMKLTSP